MYAMSAQPLHVSSPDRRSHLVTCLGGSWGAYGRLVGRKSSRLPLLNLFRITSDAKSASTVGLDSQRSFLNNSVFRTCGESTESPHELGDVQSHQAAGQLPQACETGDRSPTRWHRFCLQQPQKANTLIMTDKLKPLASPQPPDDCDGFPPQSHPRRQATLAGTS